MLVLNKDPQAMTDPGWIWSQAVTKINQMAVEQGTRTVTQVGSNPYNHGWLPVTNKPN